MGTEQVLEHLPSVSDLLKIFPVTLHAVGLFLLGYWVGRTSLTRLIDHLEKRKD